MRKRRRDRTKRTPALHMVRVSGEVVKRLRQLSRQPHWSKMSYGQIVAQALQKMALVVLITTAGAGCHRNVRAGAPDVPNTPDVPHVAALTPAAAADVPVPPLPPPPGTVNCRGAWGTNVATGVAASFTGSLGAGFVGFAAGTPDPKVAAACTAIAYGLGALTAGLVTWNGFSQQALSSCREEAALDAITRSLERARRSP